MVKGHLSGCGLHGYDCYFLLLFYHCFKIHVCLFVCLFVLLFLYLIIEWWSTIPRQEGLYFIIVVHCNITTCHVSFLSASVEEHLDLLN